MSDEHEWAWCVMCDFNTRHTRDEGGWRCMSCNTTNYEDEMSDEQEWEWVGTPQDGFGYDPDRWDPDEKPAKCQECGTWLRGAGDGSTVGQHCPECEVNVWIK